MVDCYVRTSQNISPHFIDTGHTTDDPNPKYFTYIIYILSYVSHWGRIVVELRCAHYVRVGGW